VRARSVAEAELLVADLGVDLFVVDIHLPDGSGLDFLCDMLSVHPNARLIVMTAAPLPEYRQQSEELGAVRFLEKPIDIDRMVDLIRSIVFQEPASEQLRAPSSDAFNVSLTGLTPVDVIQIKCLSRATKVIEFRTSDEVGRVHFQQGEIVHAETDTLSGVDAFNRIVSWKRGAVDELSTPVKETRTIECNWQMLLMSAAQALDESTPQPS
jgi:CheY-like chemotaxis protein